MTQRPWWAAWAWDIALLAVGVLLTLRGDDIAKHLGETILVGATFAIYASRKPGGPSGGAPVGPVDHGVVITMAAGAGKWLAGMASHV